MNPAIIVVDMLKDSFKREANLSITSEALRIIPNMKKLLDHGRRRTLPFIFACDSFLEGDFIFEDFLKEW